MEVAEMDEEGNLQVVQGLYEAFGRGDMQAVLDAFADEVDWLVPGAPAVPWAGPRTTREQIAAYFDLVGEWLDIQEHDVQEYLVRGDRVVVFGRDVVRDLHAEERGAPAEGFRARNPSARVCSHVDRQFAFRYSVKTA